MGSPLWSKISLVTLTVGSPVMKLALSMKINTLLLIISPRRPKVSSHRPEIRARKLDFSTFKPEITLLKTKI